MIQLGLPAISEALRDANDRFFRLSARTSIGHEPAGDALRESGRRTKLSHRLFVVCRQVSVLAADDDLLPQIHGQARRWPIHYTQPPHSACSVPERGDAAIGRGRTSARGHGGGRRRLRRLGLEITTVNVVGHAKRMSLSHQQRGEKQHQKVKRLIECRPE